MHRNNIPVILLGIFVVIWIISGINPRYRSTWLSEHIVTIFTLGILILTYKKFRLSNLSYLMIMLFLILNTIGSYYSYSEVPLFNLIKEEFGLVRNHYDRMVHFLYGVLFFLPFYELISNKLKVKGWWAYFMTSLSIIGTKAIYEILEFSSIFFSSQEVSSRYLGMQGDIWDTQKDMLFGLIGSLFSWLICTISTKMSLNKL